MTKHKFLQKPASNLFFDPSKPGYAFGGWFANDAFTGQPVASIPAGSTGDREFYASWAPIHTITFNANGGTVIPAFGETGAGGRLMSLPTPTLDGYAFDGWFTAEMGGTTVTTNTVFNEDATIYAQWTFITYVLAATPASANRIAQFRNGINLTAKNGATIEVYNLSGKLVSKQNYLAGSYSISFDRLPKGAYLIQARFAGLGETKKIVRFVQH